MNLRSEIFNAVKVTVVCFFKKLYIILTLTKLRNEPIKANGGYSLCVQAHPAIVLHCDVWDDMAEK